MSETCLKWQGRSKVPPNARCVPSYDFSTQKMNVGYIGPSAKYSPDLAPSDLHLFHRLKKYLAGKKFDDDDEVQEEIMTWFKGQAADFYDSGIQKLVPRLNKCLDNSLLKSRLHPKRKCFETYSCKTMMKNKVMYRQFIHSVACVN